MARPGTRTTRLREFARESLRGPVRHEVDVNGRETGRRNQLAQLRRQRINQTAFDTGFRNNEFASVWWAALTTVQYRHSNGFYRLARETASIAPRDIESTVGTAQRCDLNAFILQQRNPSTVGTQFRPACAAKRKH